jgi:hypothetical protein
VKFFGRLLAAAGLLAAFSGRGIPAWDAADTSRAATVAQQGLQSAEATLRAYFPFRAFEAPGVPAAWRFWGADKTETQAPAPGFPVESAVNPSFAVEADGDPANANVAPRTLVIDGSERGFSGAAGPGTYAANGDQYALKVSDLSGRIYVNDGLEGGSSGSVSQNLKRILNILGAICQVTGLGDLVVASRPAAGYANLQDLVAVVGGEANFARVRDFLTAHAWVDRNVPNPVPLSSGKLADYPVSYYRGSVPVYRHGSAISGRDARGFDVVPPGGLNTCPQVCAGGNHDHPAIRLYGLDSLNPQWIEIVGRAPVNVNTASREVLVALLTDLRGFFVADRRRNNPRWKGDLFLGFKSVTSLSPSGFEGDEIGFLMETVPIVGPGGTASMGISAFAVADEIVACRNRAASASFNYATVPWAGPFKSWRQFNRFVDNLATPVVEGGAGVLVDTRTIHLDYQEEVDDPTGYGPLVSSEAQRRHAVRALADVLKANFNPNLHLNETNPDENLYLRVDKTDLVVNSTEFCFVPTGHFEVESVGRVVRPRDGATDALASTDNELVGQAKVTAVYRLYDLYRETTQRQFYPGTLAPRAGGMETNNNLSVEIGPEPDNGVFPGNLGAVGDPDNEWDGYVALPTVGGVWHSAGAKPRNTLWRTLDQPDASRFNDAMHVHYTLDTDACHHVVDRREIGGRSYPDDSVENYPDKAGGAVVPYGGPYDPTRGAHRVCRSFRRPPPGGPDPALAPYAPSDLRIDGVQAERHAAPSYYVQKTGSSLWSFSTQNASGLVSFWFKPSFFPDLTGKMRKTWDMSRYHDNCGQNVYVWPFEMVYYPTNYQTGPGGVSENTGPRFWHNNVGQYQPSSFSWGSMQWHSDSVVTIGGTTRGHQFGKLTTCLNHVSHPECVQLNRTNPMTKPSPFQAHKWIHAGFGWTFNGTSDASGYALNRMYINGVSSSGASPYIPFTYTYMTGGWSEGYDRLNGFERHAGGDFNQMRFGGASRITPFAEVAQGGYRGNSSPDFTFDEIYVWRAEADGDPLLPWMLGRYSKPLGAGEGIFTSQSIALSPAGPAVRVLGLSWTWFGEGVDPGTGAPTLYDYNSPLGIAGSDVQPKVQVSLRDGAMVYGPYDDDAFSAVRDGGGATPVIADPSQVRYLAQFRLLSATVGSILLATPVLDDVTLYWDDGRASTRVDTAAPVSISGPATLPDGAAGTPYSATFTAAAGGPVTWSVSGTLPPGMTLDPATGLYSGTPLVGGTYTFTVTATSGGQSTSTQYTQVITGGNLLAGGGGGGGCGATGLEALLLAALAAAFTRGARRG